MRKLLNYICGSKHLQNLFNESRPPCQLLKVVVEMTGIGVKIAHFEEVDVILYKAGYLFAVAYYFAFYRPKDCYVPYLNHSKCTILSSLI